MNFSENISNKLTEVITNDLNYNQDKKEIIAYAIETSLLFIIGLLLLVLLGYFSGALVPIIIAATFGGSLRKVSGGAHFNTPTKCLAFGSVVYTSLGILAKKIVEYDIVNNFMLFSVLLISLLLLVFLAPVDSESKPIHSQKLKHILKFLSVVFLIITVVFVIFIKDQLINVSAVLGVFYQCITLLPVFNRMEVSN